MSFENRHTTARQLLQAAVELLSEGYGLATLGLSRAEVARRSGERPATFDHHFRRGLRDLLAALADELPQMYVREAEQNSELYELVAATIAAGTPKGVPRTVLSAVIVKDLNDFAAGQKSDDESVNARLLAITARERMYFLFVALCDLPLEKTDRVDFKQALTKRTAMAQEVYGPVYDMLLEATGREYLAGGREQTRRSINTYLTGVTEMARFDSAPPHDEVVDTVLRLFWATTKRSGTDDIDVDAELMPA